MKRRLAASRVGCLGIRKTAEPLDNRLDGAAFDDRDMLAAPSSFSVRTADTAEAHAPLRAAFPGPPCVFTSGRDVRTLREPLAEGDVLAWQFVDHDEKIVRPQAHLLHDEPVERSEQC